MKKREHVSSSEFKPSDEVATLQTPPCEGQKKQANGKRSYFMIITSELLIQLENRMILLSSPGPGVGLMACSPVSGAAGLNCNSEGEPV